MHAQLGFLALLALISVALVFDFLNGMNDAANSIATVVSTRVLRPQYAVAWAAFFNFVAFLVFGLHVAETVGRGIVQADIVTARVIFGALSGAIVWQIITNRLGIPSSSSHALGHGGNDAQKTMGIIAVLLYSQGYTGANFHVPFWVVMACQAAMAAGTLAGGWRIVKTMGSKITRLTPMQGFCAETGGSITLFAATWLGIPVSTTHTITGAIVGVGAARRVSAVRWNVAGDVVIAWVLTLPAA